MRAFQPIAIVGLGALFPGRGTTAGFWRDLVEAIDTSSEVPSSHWLPDDFFDADTSAEDKVYSTRGAFITPFAFDPLANGTPPKVVETTDSVQLIALQVARAVLKEARDTLAGSIDRERIGVILGVAAGTEMMQDMSGRLARPAVLKAARSEGLSEAHAERIAARFAAGFTEWRESTFPGTLSNVVAGRIANRLDLRGSNFVTDAACASSLAAIKHAVAELHTGEADLVLTGGADALNAIFMYMCFSKTPAMSASGACRPFSDDADGTLLGEGAGLVAFRRLEDAERDGNQIYAVLKGVGASSDGKAQSVYSPTPNGQARAIERAYEMAGFDPATIELLEAHGTATRAGDLAEINGLKQIYGQEAPKGRAWCALGSVKSQIGHTKSAAGAAGILKCALALHHKVLPPTVNVSKPNPRLGIEGSPFYLNTKSRPWIRSSGTARRAATSSFGFGGSNFHAALEEYVGPGRRPPQMRALPSELLLFSADSRAALEASIERTATGLRREEDLAGQAVETQQQYDVAAPYRAAIVGNSISDVCMQAKAVVSGDREQRNSAHLSEDIAAEVAGEPIAFLFAGQGSQYVNMGAELAIHSSIVRSVWDRYAAFMAEDERPLHEVVFPQPAYDSATKAQQLSCLTQTAHTQPALAITALGQLELLKSMDIGPEAVAGHSFGELMAFHASGAFDAECAIAFASARGLAMQNAAASAMSEGGMLAAFDNRERVLAACGALDLVVANDNGPDQVVLAGTLQALKLAEAQLEDRGIAHRRLPVATAFHSKLVAPAARAFKEILSASTLTQPGIPVYLNGNASRFTGDARALAGRMANQLAEPVLFRQMIEAMYRDGIRTFVEIGPSSILSGLVSTILKGREHMALSMDQRGTHGVTQLHRTIAALAVAGHKMNLKALWSDTPPAPRHAEPKPHELMICGANYNKPLPYEVVQDKLVENLDSDGETEILEKAEEPMTDSKEIPTAALTTHDRPSSALERQREIPLSRHKKETDEQLVVGGESASKIASIAEALDRRHEMYLETLSTSHREFMASSVRLAEALAGLAGRAPQPDPAVLREITESPPAIAPAENSAAALPTGSESQEVEQEPVLEPITPIHQAEETTFNASAPDSEQYKPTPLTGEADAALLSTLKGIVAEKTGYPAEMLDPDMDLEADLGIDSIKQVEILAAVREARPDLPSIDPAQYADLRTLNTIVTSIGGSAGGTVEPAPSPSAPEQGRVLAEETPQRQAANTETPVPARGERALMGLLQEIVAEKTGYPAEMLEAEMDLEADLGIDSIKQVEILAAVKERRPDLPTVDPAQLAELRTLTAVVAAIADQGADPLPESEDLNTVPIPVKTYSEEARADDEVATAPDKASVLAMLQEIVAEKTGYPAEMLEAEMDLEADLGIDSIKQVEILAAVKERRPDLPTVDPAQLAELRTLNAVVAAIAGQCSPLPSEPEALSLAPREVEQHAEETPDLERASAAPDRATLLAMLQEIVAEKTGYPAEMLEAEMDLEADLGIDSIKQVEILAAVKERRPDLPTVDPAQLAELRTLNAVVAAIAGSEMPSSPQRALQDPASEPTLQDALPLNLSLIEHGRAEGLTLRSVTLAERPRRSNRQESPVVGQNDPIEITGENRSIAQALTRALDSRGYRATMVKTPSGTAKAVITTAGLASDLDGQNANEAALAAARAAAPTLSSLGGAFVTLQDTGGSFARDATKLDVAIRGGLAGLAKTAAQEWPRARVRAIDIERADRDPTEIADSILDEILSASTDIEVGLTRAGKRLVPVERPVTLEARAPRLRLPDRPFIVASGGARGVTAAVLKRLSEIQPMRFLLLGRSNVRAWPSDLPEDLDRLALRQVLVGRARAQGAMPSLKAISEEAEEFLVGREITAALAAVRTSGSEVVYKPVDIRDASAVESTISSQRSQWGPVTGLVHGAGVLADKLIEHKTDAQFRQVFETKVGGLKNLVKAIGKDQPSFVSLFSSVAARYGNSGQADYAMANEALNRMSHVLRGIWPQSSISALNWGPWDGGMVTDQLRSRFEAAGVAVIPEHLGAEVFVADLLLGDSEIREQVFADHRLVAAEAGAGVSEREGRQATTSRSVTDRALQLA